MTSAGFADHFSGHAAQYARFRPRYPAALIAHLAALAPGRRLAWDCGTGSGQAALLLAMHFERVRATDPSAGQLAHAEPHPRVEYGQGREGESGLGPGCADLVVAAQAAHWFDMAAFNDEVRRVLRAGGVVALWCYDRALVDPASDEAIRWFYEERVGPWWPPQRALVERGYRDLPFPYQRIEVPAFDMTADLDRERYLGYVGTWSSVVRCREAEGRDPVAELAARLDATWPDPRQTRRVRWPLTVTAGHL